MKNLNRFMMGVALSVFALTSCSNEEQLSGTADARTPLSISVTNAGLTKVGGVVSGSQFDDGVSLGLFLTKEDGSSPYDEPYNNIKYTSSTSGGNQVWTASTPILLTGTKANVYAYYPYSSTATNIEAIPIDVTQNQDVMWATPYSGAYNASPTATLQMNHALSVIRFSLSKGDYSDAGNITSIKIKGAGMAPTGTLNAKTGAVTPTDGGAEIDLGATATLSSTPTNVEQLVIPTTASGNISVTIQMDDKTFEATSSAPITPEQSKAYKFGLAFSDSKLTMSTVTIGSITEVTVGDMKPIVNNGLTWEQAKGTDGVYAIKDDGSPVAYANATDASYAGVAIVMYGRALQISNNRVQCYWGHSSINISGIPDLKQVGGGQTGEYTHLDGTTNPKSSRDHTTWQNYPNTALADTAGWSHTEALITKQSGYNSTYLGLQTKAFREGTLSISNQGYSDWFAPACGQLAYIWLKKTEINALLEKCSGATQISTALHWSSSEYDTAYPWLMNFDENGLVDKSYYDKSTGNYYVRFLRDITE